MRRSLASTAVLGLGLVLVLTSTNEAAAKGSKGPQQGFGQHAPAEPPAQSPAQSPIPHASPRLPELVLMVLELAV